MKSIGPIFAIALSFVAMVLYLLTDEAYAAVSAFWILLVWIFVSGVKE